MAETPVGSGFLVALWGLLAILGHLLMLDAAIGTFWGGSAIRWWVSPARASCRLPRSWRSRPAGRTPSLIVIDKVLDYLVDRALWG